MFILPDNNTNQKIKDGREWSAMPYLNNLMVWDTLPCCVNLHEGNQFSQYDI